MEIDWKAADRELRRIAARRGELDAEELSWLRAARAAEVHRHLGFGTFVEYVERVLGYSPRVIADRMRSSSCRRPRSRWRTGRSRIRRCAS